jgi:hypothetical protein
MKKFYVVLLCCTILLLFTSPLVSFSQSCTGISATYQISESRCAATGSVIINATGGSGDYNYQLTGVINTPYSSSNIITGLPAGNYLVTVRDVVNNCNINLESITIPGNYEDPRFLLNVTDVTCTNGNDGTVTVFNLEGGRAPFTYTIIEPSTAGIGTTNTSGVFTNLVPGDYYIELRDSCGGIQTRLGSVRNYNWNVTAGAITRFACDSGTATITLTDMNGITNTSGTQFTNYVYGISFTPGDTLWSNSNTFNFLLGYNRSAALVAKAPCGTLHTITWFNANIPSISGVSISNTSCPVFDATVIGQANFTNPQYCLYDSTNTLVACNTTGQFTNLPNGYYCINIRDNCYDTTIVTCFQRNTPVPSIANNVSLTNVLCTTFRATIGGQQNLYNPQYCLYDNNNNLIACNGTGTFNNLVFGSYCIRLQLLQSNGACVDTTIERCFTLNKPVRSVDATVGQYNQQCSVFSARITGEVNLNSPQYCLFNNTNTLLSCNSTGRFTNLPYGSYCIRITDVCADTTIERCFTGVTAPLFVDTHTEQSCLPNFTRLFVEYSTSTAPYRVEIYNSVTNALVKTATSTATDFIIDSLPDLPPGQEYHVFCYDACNRLDDDFVTPNVSSLTKNITVVNNCPGGVLPNGSSDFMVNYTSSFGGDLPEIFRKNGNSVSIPFNFRSGNRFEFYNLEPATYILRYNYNDPDCPALYDTITVLPYTYPTVQNSNAYQCDNSGFNVATELSGGMMPFTYEITESTPAAPSIVTSPQASPQFAVNNGTQYLLVRLRAVDACGNATLNDASVLPLADVVVTASSNCYYNEVTLAVDAVTGATYQWYKRLGYTDSVLLGTGRTYIIPSLLPADTGRYFCKLVVNTGCLVRISGFDVTGTCSSSVLSDGSIALSAKYANGTANLQWYNKTGSAMKEYVLEGSTYETGGFTIAGKVKAGGSNDAATRYQFNDHDAGNGVRYYRIKAIGVDGKQWYSKVVVVKSTNSNAITVFPNPVTNALTIQFGTNAVHHYQVKLFDIAGKLVLNQTINNESYVYNRTTTTEAGMYILQVIDLIAQKTYSQQVLFK